MLIAGEREAGARCPHCQEAIVEGEGVAVCRDCGAVNHQSCWHAHDDRCGSYDCAPARRLVGGSQEPVLKITVEEVNRAAPQPAPRRPMATAPMYVPMPPEPRRSALAVASFVTALAGIPFFGLITGLVAVGLGCAALGGIHHSRRRGTVWAVVGILLGLVDAVGWLVFLVVILSGYRPHLSVEDFEPDLAAMDSLAPHVRRAVKANVLIESKRPGLLGGTGVGSGVIVRLKDGTATVLTNRHVVDPDFADEPFQTGAAVAGASLQVRLLGQPSQPGVVLWTAPDGIDLALLSVPTLDAKAEAAPWRPNRPLLVGEDVFSVGNPQHLDWSHTRGSISQLRLQNRGSRKIRVIQTDAAINPGNSGGGLYDKEGMLIGINTWTNDKRFSEGISFAIALDSLWSLAPPPLQEEAKQASSHP